MNKFLAIVVAALVVSLPSAAQDAKKEEKKEAKAEKVAEMSGYIVDAMCAAGMAKKDDPMAAAAKHTKACALEEGCAESGFGLFSDGKWYKFDEAGDAKAKALIEKSGTKKGMMVHVKGMMNGDVLAVAEIGEKHEE